MIIDNLIKLVLGTGQAETFLTLSFKTWRNVPPEMYSAIEINATVFNYIAVTKYASLLIKFNWPIRWQLTNFPCDI